MGKSNPGSSSQGKVQRMGIGVVYIHWYPKPLKIIETKILIISKLLCVLTAKAGNVVVTFTDRSVPVSTGIGQFNKMPINVGNTGCSVTGV